MRADLHLHTTASDGTLSPRELVQKAASVGLEVIAITDHDTVAGIPPALEETRSFPNLLVVPGVEINTDTPQGEVHILGYSVDYSDPEFNRDLEKLRNSRYERGRTMVTRLADMGIDVDWERVMELSGGGAIGRPHIAQVMLEQGYISSLGEAFTEYIGHDRPAHVKREKLTPGEAVKAILKTGGLPVLAHPADIPDLESFVSELKRAGIMGIEIYYPHYRQNTIARLQAVANKYDLIATGGSDYHGPHLSVGDDIGSIEIPTEVIEQFVSLIHGHRC